MSEFKSGGLHPRVVKELAQEILELLAVYILSCGRRAKYERSGKGPNIVPIKKEKSQKENLEGYV